MTYGSWAQDCKVNLAAFTSYEGECKKGKANGQGKASAENYYYQGAFKKGLPQGQGKLVFADGTEFAGAWDQGKAYGYGTMKYSDGNLKQGYWKGEIPNINYTGEDEGSLAGYKVLYSEGLDDARLKIVKNGEGEGKVVLKVRDLQNKQIFDLDFSERTGGDVRRPQTINGGIVTELNNVAFPFKGTLRYFVFNESANFRIPVLIRLEIYEQGLWSIDLTHQ